MFDLFTDASRQAMGLARAYAKNELIAPEHLLLGLLDLGDASALDVLDPEVVRGRLLECIDADDSTTAGTEGGSIHPFTPEALRALEQCLGESTRAGHEVIATAHLLAGITHLDGGPARDALAQCGVDIELARQPLAATDAALREREGFNPPHPLD